MRKIFISFVFLVFAKGCAKPEVVNIKQPNDYNLDCKGLEISVEQAQKFKKDANYAKSGTGGNVSRLLLFWPAWAQSLNNADDAIIAANNRSFHLIKVMRKKNCPDADNLEANIIDKPKNVVETNLAEQLKTLKDLYEDGHLSEEEYTKAKKKLID